jgi:hypothetical protein
MSTCRANRTPKIAPMLSRSGVFADAPLIVFDVGASGGMDDIWCNFLPAYRGFGFDPLVGEIERLNGRSPPGQRYFDAFIGWDGYESLCPTAFRQDPVLSRNDSAMARSSAVRASALAAENPAREAADRDCEGHDRALSSNRYSLDVFAANAKLAAVDVIKVDTDGSDYEVLLGARRLLEPGGALAVLVEAQFQGPVHPHANTFANIDLYLRGLGFSLFDLDLWRYSRANLPRKFVFDMPGPTHQGQVVWADALYLRDAGDPDYAAKWGALSPVQLLKAIALFELFGLDDCAAEAIRVHGAPLSERLGFDARQMLNLLPPIVEGMALSYDSYQHLSDALMRNKAWRSIP